MHQSCTRFSAVRFRTSTLTKPARTVLSGPTHGIKLSFVPAQHTSNARALMWNKGLQIVKGMLSKAAGSTKVQQLFVRGWVIGNMQTICPSRDCKRYGQGRYCQMALPKPPMASRWSMTTCRSSGSACTPQLSCRQPLQALECSTAGCSVTE